MTDRLQSFARVLRLVAAAVLTASAVQAQTLRFTEVKPISATQVRVTATGASPNPVVLEGSSSFGGWTTITTFPANTSPMIYTDNTTIRNRAYRLRSGGATPQPEPQPQPQPLTDLATFPNRVFPSPEGFQTVQYGGDGRLGLIVWKDTSLIYRERNTSGGWNEQVINNSGRTFSRITGFNYWGPREEYRFQPSAGLVFDSASRPHVFMVSGRTVVHYSRNNSGAWTQTEVISNTQANGDLEVLEVGIGANDAFHLGALTVGPSRNLTYGSNKNGSWSWTKVSDVTDAAPTYWAPPFAPRWLSMAVDSSNNAHFAFRSSMDLSHHPQGYPRAYSVLKYATSRDGFAHRVVSTPVDSSGEAANGASIAIAPDGKPSIVSWYDERAETGSAQESYMFFHQPDAAGNWSKSLVNRTADGYVAGDGNKGTGFSPYLRYDSRGRAHILFMDHAGEHFAVVGQQEYAGNVRHAWWNGSSWSFETVFRQTNPLAQQAVYPAFAMSPNGSELAVTVLQRDSTWVMQPYPPIATSTYTFRFFTKPLL